MRNGIILLGRLHSLPIIKPKVTYFSIDVDDFFVCDKNGNPTKDTFQVTVFGNAKRVVDKYIDEVGMTIQVTAKLKNNNYIDKNGKTVFTNAIIGHEIEFG